MKCSRTHKTEIRRTQVELGIMKDVFFLALIGRIVYVWNKST